MNLKAIILLLVLSPLLGQDRSLIFSTGAPDGTEGHSIEFNGTYGTSLSDRIFISNNMVLEALKVYAEASTAPAMARIILQADDGGLPGEEIYSWTIDVEEENHGNNYFLIITTDLCIYLDAGNYYWLTLHADDPDSQISWYYSNNATFTYTTSSDLGVNWETPSVGNCGALSVWAEYIYEPEVDEMIGDINADGDVNILDVVLLANAVLTGNYLSEGDINGDGMNNVLDIVGLVNIILNGPSYEQLPTWDYVDINTNSDYFDQLIGPDTFNGNVSLYYFGKAG
jgi:hypothetical protein